MKFKRVLCYFLLAFFSFQLQAQDVIYRKNTVYVDGKPYAYLHKQGSNWAKDLSFRNLKNEELISIKAVAKVLGGGYEAVYYEVHFLGMDLKTEMQDDHELARRLAYELASFNVVVDDKLNPEGVQKFLERYPANRFSSQNFIAR